MEHSKLHIGVGNKVSRTNIYDSKERFVAEIGPCGRGLDFDVAHALEFVACWNQHDTLQAKADLLDETVGDVKRIESAQHRGDWMALDSITKEILKKAESLK